MPAFVNSAISTACPSMRPGSDDPCNGKAPLPFSSPISINHHSTNNGQCPVKQDTTTTNFDIRLVYTIFDADHGIYIHSFCDLNNFRSCAA